MTIDSINSGQAAQGVVSAFQIKLSDVNRSNFLEKLDQVKGSIEELNENVKAKKSLIKKNECFIKQLKAISTKHGDNVSVRTKYLPDGNKKGEYHFKNGEVKGFFKNLFHGTRYEAERKETAKLYPSEEKTVSVKNLRNQIVANKNELLDSKTNLESDIQKLEKIKSDIQALPKSPDWITKNLLRTAESILNPVQLNTSREAVRAKAVDFCTIWQTDEGAKAINNLIRRRLFNSPEEPHFVNSKAITQEYEETKGSDIFFGGNKELKSNIQIQTKYLNDMELIKFAIDNWYNPGKKDEVTYRGQTMTEKGIEMLQKQFEIDPDTTFAPGQFFATSPNKHIADNYPNAKRLKDNEVKIIFEITGNSSGGIMVDNGLEFNNASEERERLYSPHARFKITSITPKDNENYLIKMKEVPGGNDSKIVRLNTNYLNAKNEKNPPATKLLPY